MWATSIHNTRVSVSYRPEPTTPNRSAHVSVDGDHRTFPPGHSVSHTYGSITALRKVHLPVMRMCVCMCKVQLA